MKYLLLPLILAAASCRPSAPAPSSSAPDDPDRKELVLQPLRKETYAEPAQKLDIRLISEKTSIVAKKDRFRYRLEIKNVGRDAVSFKEPAPSFIKDGSLCGKGGFQLEVAAAGGAPAPLPCAGPGTGGAALDVALLPGEYLLTRASGPSDRFRSVESGPFEKPGKYRIRVLYAAGGLRAESNAVELEVVVQQTGKGNGKPYTPGKDEKTAADGGTPDEKP